MFIEDIKNDFYDVLLGKRVLMLVHYDVDAICACKILQELFKCDNVSYTLVPVGGISELKSAYEDNNEEIKYVALINCGGTVDLVDILQPEEDVVFFVLDSHKPTDVCNVYSDGQVRLVYKDSDEVIPEFDAIFRDDEEDEEEPEPGREGLEAAMERRRARREWEERRHALMFNYTQFSWGGKPSSLIAVELSIRVSRCGAGTMWAAGVGAEGAAAEGTRGGSGLLLDVGPLLARVAARARGGGDQGAVVEFVQDACVPLYRVWSVEAALGHAPRLAPALKLHTRAGGDRLRRLLADMGFPLAQARQAYRAMDVELRRALPTALEEACGRLSLPSMSHSTFVSRRPLSPPRAALDTVYAIMGLIEHEVIPQSEGFQLSLSALDLSEGGGLSALSAGQESGRAALQACARLAHGVLAARDLRRAGPFNYFVLHKGSADVSVARHPGWLRMVGRWVAAGAGGGALLAAAPRGDDALLLGVPPSGNDEPRNLFGAAFAQAAAKSGVPVGADFIDSSVITLPLTQLTKFLDALTALLA